MSNIDIQVVLSNRYRTSQEADGITIEMWQALGLDTKAQFARLAIGRSLAMGPITDDTPDSKGIEVPAQALFSTDNIGAWIGLLVAHSISSGSPVINSQDALRAAVRCHWHRGAKELYRDWLETEKNYAKFVEVLISRRSEMPDTGSGDGADGGEGGGGNIQPSIAPVDESVALVKALDALGIKVQVKETLFGARLTRYKVLLMNLNDAAKLSRNVSQLALAMNLGDKLPVISNGDKPMTVFIDVPRLRATWSPIPIDRLQTWATQSSRDPSKLEVYAGVTVTGDDVVFDLTSAPHLLVGGTTNSGKSLCLHSLILSLLLKHNTENLQLALIDPKRVEFSSYRKLQNLYGGKVAVEVSDARDFLENLLAEMEARYSTFERLGVANIAEAREKGQKLPFIVVFVEELADLILQDKTTEQSIERLAQKARAAGIHLVLATQRPDAETFSGLIRTNVPSRIALTVRTSTESKIILGEPGAENLLGAGDMLIKITGDQVVRAHGVFVKKEHISQR